MPPKRRSASKSPGRAASKPKATAAQTEEQLYAKLFDSMDTDFSGYLDFDELYTALVSHHNAPPQITPQVVHNMVKEADIDGNGLIDLKEFVSIMKNAKTSQYWKTTSSSLWGGLNNAVSTVGLITEQILKPVHEAVAMHAHPHVHQGKLVSMSPNVFVRIVGGLLSTLSVILFLPWLCIPLIGWERGKTLPAWWFGYHYEDKYGNTNPGGSVLNPLLMKLNLITLVSTVVLPCFLWWGGLYYVDNFHAPKPQDKMDYNWSTLNDLHDEWHADAFEIGYYFTGFWVGVILFSSLICLQFSERNQTIWEFWSGAYAVIDA